MPFMWDADADRKLLFALCEIHAYNRQPLPEEAKVAQIVGSGCIVTDVKSRLKIWAKSIASIKILDQATPTIPAAHTALQHVVSGSSQLAAYPNPITPASREGPKDAKSSNKREATEHLKEDVKRFCTSDVGAPAAEDLVVRLGIRIGKLGETIVEKDKGIAVYGENIRRLGEDLQKCKEEIRTDNMHMEGSQTNSEHHLAKVEHETQKLKKSQKEVMELCKYKELQSQHKATQSEVVKHIVEVGLLHAAGLERDKEILSLQTRAISMKTKIKTQAEEIAICVEQKFLESKRADIISLLWERQTVTLRNVTQRNEFLKKGVAIAKARAEDESKERQEAEQMLETRDARIIQLEEGLRAAQGVLQTLLEGGG